MRILLADHHLPVLKALQTRLQEAEGFSVVGTASDAANLIREAEQHHPDVILFDWNIPGRRGEALIEILHSLEPRPRVIIMSTKLDVGRVSLATGADAFFSKGEDANRLIETLQALRLKTEKPKND